MLAYFPKPFPNELWYSVLCRLKHNIGYTDRIFSKCILNDRLIFLKVLLGFIDYNHLVQISYGYLPLTVPDIIKNHTIIPYMKNFIGKNYDWILSEDTYNSPVKSLITNFINDHQSRAEIKYCRSCIEENERKYGIPYLLTHHQLPGYHICHIHHEVLTIKGISKRRANTIKLLDIENLIKEESNSYCPLLKSKNQLLRLSKLTFELWQNPNRNLLNEIQKDIFELYEDNSLKTKRLEYGHLIRDLKLANGEFLNYYLKEFGNHVTYEKLISKLFNENLKIKPPFLTCLVKLLLDHLKNSKDIPNFKPDKKALTFGKGPYQCLNKVCSSFGNYEAVMVDFFKGKRKNITAKFECVKCGNIYTKSIFPNGKEGKAKITTHGQITISKLRVVAKNCKSFGELKKMFGLHEATLVRLIAINNLECQALDKSIQSNQKLQYCQKLISDLILSGISISKNYLFKYYKKECDYIRFNNYKWYLDNIKSILQ